MVTVFGDLDGVPMLDATQPKNMDDPQALAFYVRASRQARRIIGLMRWRLEGGGDLHKVHSVDYAYLSANETWESLSRGLHLELRLGLAIPQQGPTEAGVREVQRLIDAGRSEPLAHELFREAWQQRGRSAVVLAMTALETAYDNFESQKAPGVKKSKKRRGSTPVVLKMRGMLRNHRVVVTHPNDPEKKFVLSPEFFRTLKGLLDARNEIVHEGRPAPSAKELDEMLRCVQQALWVFDLLNGETWSGEKIFHGTFVAEQAGPSASTRHKSDII
jgi:hypothetical protein